MRFAKAISSLIALTLMLLGLGALFEVWTDPRQRAKYAGPTADYLTLQDGSKIRVRRTGSATAPATVVLEAGLAGTSLDWRWIQEGLGEVARIVSYDRAGIGWSDASGAPVTASAAAERLHEILGQTGATKVILVAHSLGAAHALVYRQKYPESVAGIVLVDPVHPDQMTRLPKVDVDGDHYFFNKVRIAAQLSRFGFMRFFHLWGGFAAGLGPDAERESRAMNGSRKHLHTVEREIGTWDRMMDEMRQAGMPVGTPTAILSSSLPATEGTRVFQALHDEMAKAVPGATHDVIPAIDHQGLLTDPTAAGATISAIKRILAGTITTK